MKPKFILPMLFVLTATTLVAADQTQVGAGNAVAEQIAGKSALVQSAKEQLLDNAKGIKERRLGHARRFTHRRPSHHVDRGDDEAWFVARAGDHAGFSAFRANIGQ
jgi:hypothetical protein